MGRRLRAGSDVYSSYAKQPYIPASPPPSGPISFDGWANWNGTSFAAPKSVGEWPGGWPQPVARWLAVASLNRPVRGAVLNELSEQTFRVGWFVP